MNLAKECGKRWGARSEGARRTPRAGYFLFPAPGMRAVHAPALVECGEEVGGSGAGCRRTDVSLRIGLCSFPRN